MIIVLLVVLGLCLGSFVNAFVWRFHELSAKKVSTKRRHELSIVHGRSMCPSCGHQLTISDLLPAVSWLLLRGKCRYCGKPISWQYPVVELLTAGLFVLSYIYWPDAWQAAGIFHFVVWLPILTGLIALAIYDLRWMLLPNKIVYSLLLLVGLESLGLAIIRQSFAPLAGALMGALVIGGLFYLLFQVSAGRWIGGGDVKLGFVLGAATAGFFNSLLVIFIASLAGTIVILPLLATRKLRSDSRIPFGPFLILATVVVQLFGAALIAWYKRQLLL